MNKAEAKQQMQDFIEAEIKKDFSANMSDIWERLGDAGLQFYAYDTVKRWVIDARKRNVPTLEEMRHPKYNPDFDWRRHPGDAKEKCIAYISNQLYRNRLQSASQLRKKVDQAGMGLTLAKASFAIWVSEARKQTGLFMSQQEAALLARVKIRKGAKQNRNPKPKIDIYAGPPVPGHVDPSAALRLASDVLREAWETAGKRQSFGDTDSRYSGTRAPSFDVRYAQAWLQSPSATAMWCDMAGVDPDVLAKLSRNRHGKPRFGWEEIEKFRSEQKARAEQVRKDRARIVYA